MGQVLGSSQRVVTLAETHYFENMIDGKDLDKILDNDKKKELASLFFKRSIKGILGIKQISNIEKKEIKNYLFDLEEFYPQKLTGSDLYICMLDILASRKKVDTICEQTGKYIFFYDTFSSFNLDIRIFHMIRNPKNVIRSEALKYKIVFLGLNSIPAFETIRVFLSYNPLLLSLVIDGFEKQYKKIKESSLGIRIKKFRFERLTNSKDYIDEIKTFSDLDDIDTEKVKFWGSSIISEGSERKKGIVNNSKSDLKYKSFRVSAGLYWVSLLLRKYMMNNNYRNDFKYSQIIPGIGWLLITPFQLFLIFIFNIKRAPNFLLALKRRIL